MCFFPTDDAAQYSEVEVFLPKITKPPRLDDRSEKIEELSTFAPFPFYLGGLQFQAKISLYPRVLRSVISRGKKHM